YSIGRALAAAIAKADAFAVARDPVEEDHAVPGLRPPELAEVSGHGVFGLYFVSDAQVRKRLPGLSLRSFLEGTIPLLLKPLDLRDGLVLKRVQLGCGLHRDREGKPAAVRSLGSFEE